MNRAGRPLRRVSVVTWVATVLCAVGVMAASAPAASAVTRYAAPTGASSGDCTTEATACTLSRAVSGFASTTEVVVLPGTYESASQITVNGINVHGKRGEPAPVVNSTASGAAIGVGGNSGRLADLRLNKTAGSFGALFMFSGSEPLVERVHATVNTPFGVACFQGDGLLRDSFCLATGPNGQAVSANLAGAASATPKVRNVTAVATGEGSEGISYVAGAQGASVAADVKSTIAQGASSDVFVANCNNGAGASVVLANSNYSTANTSSTGGCQPGSATPPGTGGNQTAEPAFVGIASGDLSQLPTSPTIDAGIADADTGAEDGFGGDRVSGEAIDIGAHEYVVEPPVMTTVTPVGPADHNQPVVSGTAPMGTTVSLFATADCGGTPIATGSDAEFAVPGLTATVPDNSTTAFRATATDAWGHRSDCSPSSVSYQEVTPTTSPPPPPPPGSASPAPTATETKRGCPKGKKLRKVKGKRKCVKRKRK